MRIPLAVTLESRDGTVDQDAICRNALVEVKGEQSSFRKRPGISDMGLIKAGVAQLLTYWDDQVIAIIDDYINVNTSLLATNVTTLNASDKGASVTLSNGDLTATWADSTYDAVRSTSTKAAGYWYWEATLDASASVGIGFANLSDNLDDATVGTTTANAIAYYSTGVIQFNNSNIQTSLATATTGDIIGVLYDVDNGTLQFYKNGVALGTQVTSASLPAGALYAYLSGNSSNPVVTVNFGATSFSHPPTSSSTLLTVSTADLPFSAQDNGRNAPKSYLMFKNAEKAFTLDTAGTIAAITDTDYPGTYAVTLTSLTQTGGTATATTAVDTNFQVGSSVTIAGATPTDYNGAKTILTITPSTSLSTTPVAITLTRSGTTATAVTKSEPHGFTNGQTVTIAGAAESAYNGSFIITWISATSFSYTVTVTGGITTPATTATALNALIDLPYAECSVTVSSGTATVTRGGHGYETGATVRVYLLLAGWPELVGAITVTDANTFTVATSLGDYSATQGFVLQRLAGTVSSITGSGTTATVTMSASHYITRPTQITISGALESYYNGTFYPVVVTGATTFTYQMNVASASSPATPATGTITAQRNAVTGASFTYAIDSGVSGTASGTMTATGGRNTVPGIPYLDGYFCVMDVNGVVYNSKEDDPTAWEPLEYTIAQAESGAGKHLTRSLNYLVAFKEWSTEFFYNAANEPPGSPFSPVENGFTQIGCASGDSVAHLDGAIYWLAQARQKGRSVYVMRGTEQQKISTPDVERILNADDLATVHAYGLKLDGHPLYVLTLVTSDITLVYDAVSQAWSQWSSLTLGSQVSVTSITRSGTTATVTATSHGLSDGDPVKIAGANQAEYNGIFQVSYVSANVFTIEVTGSPATGSGTILMYPYTETYFKFSKAANLNGVDGLLHESDGHLYKLDSTVYQDNAIPINVFARTARMDGGTIQPKTMSRVYVIGDKASDTLMIRWSDDDSTTFSAYRRVTLSDERPNIRRCGAFKRRSMELRHLGNTALNLSALELEVGQ